LHIFPNLNGRDVSNRANQPAVHRLTEIIVA
jgi:hypothetical protein